MDRPPVQNGQTARQATANGNGKPMSGCWQTSILSHSVKILTDDTHNYRVAGITQPSSVFCDYIQHRLHVSRRAGDDAQNLTRRSLLLQRFLEFVEQSHVLDCNHGLVGEGFQKLDLCRGEGANLGTTCVE